MAQSKNLEDMNSKCGRLAARSNGLELSDGKSLWWNQRSAEYTLYNLVTHLVEILYSNAFQEY